MKFKVIYDNSVWGVFDTEEEAYNFALNQVRVLRLICGDIYIDYKIVKEDK